MGARNCFHHETLTPAASHKTNELTEAWQTCSGNSKPYGQAKELQEILLKKIFQYI
jgi:hypothetical protein